MEMWEIRPFDGCGPVKFGMSRSEVRALLGSHFSTFKKGAEAFNLTDSYDSIGLHLYYDGKGELDFVEAFSPCAPCFNEIHFIGNNPQRILAQMRALGHEAIAITAVFCFERLGISIYVPSSEAVKIESVGLFRRDKFASYLTSVKAIAEKERLRAERRKATGPPKNPFRSGAEK
jgi:hypothetical protein